MQKVDSKFLRAKKFTSKTSAVSSVFSVCWWLYVVRCLVSCRHSDGPGHTSRKKYFAWFIRHYFLQRYQDLKRLNDSISNSIGKRNEFVHDTDRQIRHLIWKSRRYQSAIAADIDSMRLYFGAEWYIHLLLNCQSLGNKIANTDSWSPLVYD